MVSTQLRNMIVKIGKSSPRIGMKITKIWNHRLGYIQNPATTKSKGGSGYKGRFPRFPSRHPKGKYDTSKPKNGTSLSKHSSNDNVAEETGAGPAGPAVAAATCGGSQLDSQRWRQRRFWAFKTPCNASSLRLWLGYGYWKPNTHMLRECMVYLPTFTIKN